MAIYTGVADANGDFTVPFSSNYTSGEKITISAEKDGAIKTIELHAPSEVVGGGAIQFSGSLDNFPQNIGAMIFSSGVKSISDYAFSDFMANGNTFASSATALEFEAVEVIGEYAFYGFKSAQKIDFPDSLISIGANAFENCTSLTSITIPANVQSLGSYALGGLISLSSLSVKRGTPPKITSDTLYILPSTCKIYVPAASLSAYKAAANWKAHASKMIGI